MKGREEIRRVEDINMARLGVESLYLRARRILYYFKYLRLN